MFLPKQNPNCGLLDRRAVTVCADLLVYKSEMSQSYQMEVPVQYNEFTLIYTLWLKES